MAALAAVGTSPAIAQKATVAKVARITAKIEALDRAGRTVTLRGTRGAITFAAGPDVRGFDQVRTGDLVVVRYLEPVLVDIRKRDAAPRDRVAPGGEGTARRLTVAAEVLAKDAARRTVTLRGAKQTVELRAGSADQLKAIQVGDRVEATYTEAAAISIELAVSRPNETKK